MACCFHRMASGLWIWRPLQLVLLHGVHGLVALQVEVWRCPFAVVFDAQSWFACLPVHPFMF